MSRPLRLVPDAPERLAYEAPPFACASSNHGAGATWVQAKGALDLAAAPKLAEVLRSALREARLVVLDLGRLTFLDSSGVHVIVDATIAARRQGRRLLLLEAPASVQRMFALTETSHLVEVFGHPSPDPAVQVLPRRRSPGAERPERELDTAS